MRLVIGSRGSPLALWQAHYVAKRLEHLGYETNVEIIKTTGDHLQTASLTQAGGKGLFTKEIEEALLEGKIDLAVHSLKDLPTENPAGLQIAAIPEREDPSDALVGKKLAELPEHARVGTSSGRRAAQLRLLRPDLTCEPIRGNVDTRLRKLKEGQFDAIMLAAAGLCRLGMDGEIAERFPPEQICPAPGQGALGIQTRRDDRALEICSLLDHAETRDCVTCERAALAALGGGCQLPVGAFASVSGELLMVQAIVLSPDGQHFVRSQKEGKQSDAEALGAELGRDLIEKGAASLLAGAVAL